MTDSQYYGSKTGKYNKAYNRLYHELVLPYGEATTPNGKLLQRMTEIYYKYHNKGHTYEKIIENKDNVLTNIKDVNMKFLKKLHQTLLYSYSYEDDLEMVFNNMMRYLILKKSNPEKIYNPETGRLVKISTPQGIKILKDLNCKIEYSFEL